MVGQLLFIGLVVIGVVVVIGRTVIRQRRHNARQAMLRQEIHDGLKRQGFPVDSFTIMTPNLGWYCDDRIHVLLPVKVHHSKFCEAQLIDGEWTLVYMEPPPEQLWTRHILRPEDL